MIVKYLDELLVQKNKLVDNLKARGIHADYDETLNTLVPKILEISGGGFKKIPLFVSGENVPNQYADTIFTIYQNGIEALSGYIRDNKQFCNKNNNYVLNYNQTDFGWDGFVYTASIQSIHIAKDTAIAIAYQSGTTEHQNLLLIPVNNKPQGDTIQNYVFSAIKNNALYEVPFYWLYCDDIITSMATCENIPEGDYYLCWLGRSNNTHPIIKSVMIYQ